jgi:hypothetical protein
MWDFTIRERAEQYWAEAHVAAREQRRVRLTLETRAAHRRAAEPHGGRGAASVIWWRLWIRRFAGGLGLIAALGLLPPGLADAATPAARLRALAENVLGAGTVRAVSTIDEGRTLVIRWESATFKPTNTLAATREFLYAEAVLTSSAVMASLPEVTRVRFTIVRDGRPLAAGEALRGQATLLAFSAEVGGGVYESPVTVKTTRPGGGRTEVEL